MKNRVLGLAIAASILAPQFAGTGPTRALQAQPTPNQLPGGATTPAGGIGSTLGDVVRKQSYGGGFYEPRYRKERGPGHLAAKRLKRKRRNRLRAKRQFRKAVR